MTRLALFVALFLSLSAPGALAADQLYPAGGRVGITPPVGLAESKTHVGFVSADRDVIVLIQELPPSAFTEAERIAKLAAASGANSPAPKALETKAGTGYFSAEMGTDQAGKPVRRYWLVVSGGTFAGHISMQVPETAQKIYTDEAVRAMFASVTAREKVPVEEALSNMPFQVTDTASFPTIHMLSPRSALLLADADDLNRFEIAPFMVLSTVRNVPEKNDERQRYAEQAATVVPGLRNVRITSSEPMRIRGTAGFETRMEGVMGKDDTPVAVVQWLRFGSGGGAIRIIASTPKADWSKAFPRFREVRDGIEPL